ncbi:hypothetical protein [Leucobacter sp. G161]|uniref:hypothetical protein n=1 Tax=Leucobacter sp. G161 TaxID=663704 RepID=UPI00073C1FF5|nr:hypothetical protein [Leucobacter sp. G161]KUF07054.1 hypothetical protein AUL38_01755 [Leucobacter sp. G161]
MRKLTLFIFGVATGFVAAHFVNQSPGGHRFFERVNRGIAELANAFSNGYEAAEREQFDEDLERTLKSLDRKSS